MIFNDDRLIIYRRYRWLDFDRFGAWLEKWDIRLQKFMSNMKYGNI